MIRPIGHEVSIRNADEVFAEDEPDEELIRGALDAPGEPNIAANRQEGPIYRKQEPRPVS